MAVTIAAPRNRTAGSSDPSGPARAPLGFLLLLLGAVLFLGYGLRTIAAPFGDSHDGRNAAVWAAGIRNIRQAGPLASRLGTRNPESGIYANHPP